MGWSEEKREKLTVLASLVGVPSPLCLILKKIQPSFPRAVIFSGKRTVGFSLYF
jgi:hypothetical protein